MKEKIELYIVKVKGNRYFSYMEKGDIVLKKYQSNAAMIDYQHACAVAFDLNKQHGAIDYAVIESVEVL
jgi:hypothetical protein